MKGKGKPKMMGSPMMNKGGKVPKVHEGKSKGKKEHKVEGPKAGHRLDKFARGGKVDSAAGMSPSSPMSKTGEKGRPGKAAPTTDKADD